MITRLEELSNNAWPAMQTMLYDGWILRFAEGYTKRANSVQPIYADKLDINEKVEYCEKAYDSKGLDCVFKMTSAVYPKDLDMILEGRGYIEDSPTSVQVLKIKDINCEGVAEGFEYDVCLNDTWLDDFCRLAKVNENSKGTLKNILENIISKTFFTIIKRDGETIACGLGVLQNGFIGLFDIAVDERLRNMGYGRKIVSSIIGLGAKNGAEKAYLQVMLNNPPALKLYKKVGFEEVYKYWYRVKKQQRRNKNGQD